MKKKIFPKIIIGIGALLLLASGYMVYGSVASIEDRKQAVYEIDTHLANHVATPFENSAKSQEAPAIEMQSEALYSYQATDTLMFSSHSEAWNETKLQELYDELLQNKHGDEMATLHEVIVWPQEGEEALATHSSDVIQQSLEVSFGALPEDFHLNFARNVSLIDLYDGDNNTTIESMAGALSHEYGHLYTFYYMFNEATEDLSTTEYATFRNGAENGLNSAPTPDENYWEDHYKYLFEVAANDYVQLMGSPTTRTILDFQDVRQVLGSGEERKQEILPVGNNAAPQENLEIPLASEVAGLSEYFHQFINEPAPAPVEPRTEIKISIESGSLGYDLVGGYRKFVYYDLKWNTPYADTVYTLVCYDSEEYQIRPIKTVHIGKDPIATIGTVTKQSGNYVNFLSDENDEGTKTFIVIAQLPDGTYYSSEPLIHTF